MLAEEQAALRRVATLVARGTPPEEVFAAVTEEIGQLLALGFAYLGRFEPDNALTTVAAWGRAADVMPAGTRWILGGKNVSTLVLETGRAVRLDRYADASGPVGDEGRENGFRSAVGTPVIVEGRVWGVIAAASALEETLPTDTEARLASFTELVATAIANAESRAALARLAGEQAALRRVATLVARGAPPEKVFAAVIEEVGQLRCPRRWPTRPSTRGPPLCTLNSTRTTRWYGWRSATTGSEALTPPGDRGWSASATASRRSAARSKSPVPPATAPPCTLRSQPNARTTHGRPDPRSPCPRSLTPASC